MADFYQTVTEDLSPVEADGVLATFATPTDFRPGTIKVIINGLTYTRDDDLYALTENGTNEIILKTVPVAGDVMQATYQLLDPVTGGPEVIGSPFAPGETC